MKKLKFQPKTLEDKLAIDGLCAISMLDRFAKSRGMYYLVGGFATQSYLPITHRRGTCDIDLAIMKPMSYTEFRDFASPVIEYLKDNKYEVETDKGQNAYELYYSEGPEGDGGVIEFNRRSENNFKKHEKKMIREMDNSRVKTVHGLEATYRVTAPEDIAIPKAARGVGNLERNQEFIELHVGRELRSMNDCEVFTYKDKISKLRESAILHIGDPKRSDELRLVSDIYDTRALGETVGFNNNYLEAAARDWNKITTPGKERDVLLKFLMPCLLKLNCAPQPTLDLPMLPKVEPQQ